jgi:hypothetical protein
MADNNEDAYIGLRHLSPDTVRLLRAALDMDVKVDTLRKQIKNQKGEAYFIQLTLDCLDYLVSNPEAGKVCFLEGERYDFVDRLTKDGRLPEWYQPGS